MKKKEKSLFVIVGNFVKKYAWLIAICAAVLALVFLFLPILKYEIREAVYDIASGDRVSKSDYVYEINLISYFNTGFAYNFSFL